MRRLKLNILVYIVFGMSVFFSSVCGLAQILPMSPGVNFLPLLYSALYCYPIVRIPFAPVYFSNVNYYPLPVMLSCSIAPPAPLLPSPPLLHRVAATTTILPALTPGTGLTVVSPVSILNSLLFSPLPSTTTVTYSATIPGTTTSLVPNYVSAPAIKKPTSTTTTVTTTTTLPGLTSFLPLIILLSLLSWLEYLL